MARSTDAESEEEEEKTECWAVVNPTPYDAGFVITICRDGPDNAIYSTPEKAFSVRDDLAEQAGNENLQVKKMALTDAERPESMN